jgi:ketosteroid isomerase-like protein
MSATNIAFVQSLYAAFGRGDIKAVIAGLAPDVDWTVNGRRPSRN